MPNESDDGDNDPDEKVSLGAKVPPDFKQEVRVMAALRGISMSQYVYEAVEQKLEEDKEEGNTISPVPQRAD